MVAERRERRAWKDLVESEAPLILPAAHDALTAKLIERAGFVAYQVGGFAVDGTRFGFPDIDLTHYGEKSDAARQIIAASSLPVLVDGDDGYGDAKNVTRTVQGYEAMGASALFIEDQRAPKRCGHMAHKEVIPPEQMEQKVRAAVSARRSRSTFVLARTDALQPEGLERAIARAEGYLKAGADGVYVEGPRDEKDLEKIGRALRGVPLATSILEGGGKTPWLPPAEMHRLGYSMLLYPTTILFRLTHSIQRALADLKAGRPMPRDESVRMSEFEEIVDMPAWKQIEDRFGRQ